MSQYQYVPAPSIPPPTVAYIHVCVTCGNPRSAGYHRDHPLIPGEMPLPTECGRCARRRRQRNAEDDRTNSESYSAAPSKPSKSKKSKALANEENKAQSKPKERPKIETKNNLKPDIRAKKEIGANSNADKETGEGNSKQKAACDDQIRDRRDKTEEPRRKYHQRRRPGSFDSILAHVSESEDGSHITIIKLPRRRRSRERRSSMDTETGHNTSTTRHIRTVHRRSPSPSHHRRSPSPNRDRRRYEDAPTAQLRSQHVVRQDRYYDRPSDYTTSESTFTHQMRDAGWYDRIQHVPAGEVRGNRLQTHRKQEPEFTPSNSTLDSPPSRSPREGQRSASGYVRLPPAQYHTYGQYAEYHNQPPTNTHSNAQYPPSNIPSNTPYTPHPIYDDEADQRGRSRHVHFPEDEMMSGGRSPARDDGRYDRRR
jgi:hypothetical protein